MSIKSFEHILANIQEETNQNDQTSSQQKTCQKLDPCIILESLENCKECLFAGIIFMMYIGLILMIGLLYFFYKDQMKI